MAGVTVHSNFRQGRAGKSVHHALPSRSSRYSLAFPLVKKLFVSADFFRCRNQVQFQSR